MQQQIQHSYCFALQDALILAKSKGYDVFNSLDILQNIDFLKDLKFGQGDGFLQYYLYNWRVATDLTPQQVGFILL
jgi:glycylpeptide N-tetradecanoyltransferase